MGYISDVAIATTKSGYEALCEEHDDSRVDLFHEGAYQLFIYDNEYIMFWHEVKWYGEDVDYIMGLLKNIDMMGYPYYYIRKGEDAGDIESYCSEMFNLRYWKHLPRVGLTW